MVKCIFKFILCNLMIFLVAVCISGCFRASTAVSSIGAHEAYGEAKINDIDKVICLEIKEYELEATQSQFGTSEPYYDLRRSARPVFIGNITFKYSDINWTNMIVNKKNGQLDTFFNGSHLIFNATETLDEKTLFLKSRYRKWYGYPAQSLMIITLPLDSVITASVIGMLIIVYPIYHLCH